MMRKSLFYILIFVSVFVIASFARGKCDKKCDNSNTILISYVIVKHKMIFFLQ